VRDSAFSGFVRVFILWRFAECTAQHFNLTLSSWYTILCADHRLFRQYSHRCARQ
jgi:hypothetical protein